jgi:hypothetical protein
MPIFHRHQGRWGQGAKEEREIQVAKTSEKAVLVTTAHRGVFFGYASKTDGAVINLRAARNCVYWPSEQKGFLGLANMGPVNGSRIGPAADIELRDITCVAECTDEAVKRWENAPWSR